MVKQVNHQELKQLIKHYYTNKLAFFVWGRFGIGKSQVVKDTARDLAGDKKREFKEWNKMSDTEKAEVVRNPKKYFVLCDFRLSEYDSSDIKGLPVFKDDKKSIDFKVPYWALFMENPESDGILFFDEINLATPLVISSCYKIIYDRVINENRVSDSWLIMGAGNLSEDRAYTHDIAPPLRDRGGEVELVGASVDDWVDWAIPNQMDSRIIGFVKSKSSNLWKVNFEDNQKFTTYRGWERLSKLIVETKGRDYAKLGLISGSAIGEGVATEFVAFCKIQEKVKVDEIIKNPKLIEKLNMEVDVKYFLVTAVADKYKDKKVKFEKVVEISKVLDKLGDVEFVALMWRMCCAYNPKQFKNEFINKLDDSLANKYAKYII